MNDVTTQLKLKEEQNRAQILENLQASVSHNVFSPI